MGDPVQLTDLDVITRYSIAVRSATADRDELLQTLRADLAWLERGRPRSAAWSRTPASDEVEYDEPEAAAEDYDYEYDEVEEEPAPRPQIRRMAVPQVSRTPARKTTSKSTAAKRTTAKKTAAKKTTTRRAR
jgi:hypothetical protein